MKHCPACNFSFPDFHKVCDFDGTELVPDVERPALVSGPRPQTRFGRTLKSPLLWAAALLLFVLSSAFLVAYLETTVQSPASVKAEPSSTSSVNARSAAGTSDDAPSDRETRVVNRRPASRNSPKSRAIKARRPAIVSRSVQPRERGASTARSQRTETATRAHIRQTEMKSSRQVPEDKEPKVIAALKTTWRVLKKPFKF